MSAAKKPLIFLPVPYVTGFLMLPEAMFKGGSKGETYGDYITGKGCLDAPIQVPYGGHYALSFEATKLTLIEGAKFRGGCYATL